MIGILHPTRRNNILHTAINDKIFQGASLTIRYIRSRHGVQNYLRIGKSSPQIDLLMPVMGVVRIIKPFIITIM